MGRQLLQTAVIIGRSFDLDTLRVASGRSDEETIVALEELIGQRLIRESVAHDEPQSPEYDFSHEKMREVIYEDTSLARRRLLHHRVAQALTVRQRWQRGDALAGPIAQHYQWAGRREEAAEYFFRAGEYARSLYAHVEALAHYQAALTAGYTDAALIHERLGDLHTLRGEYRAALQSYESAAALKHTEVAALACVEHSIGNVYQRQGERDLAEAHYQTALNLSGSTGDPILRVQIYNDASLNAQHHGQFDRAVDLANQALALAQTAEDRRSLAQAHNILGILSRHCRDDATALYHLQQSLALAESLDDPIARMAALNNLALVYADRDDVDQAIGLTQQALALCETLGDRHHAAALHNNLADLLHAANRHEAAMVHLKEAVTLFAEIGGEAGHLQPEIWKLTEW